MTLYTLKKMSQRFSIQIIILNIWINFGSHFLAKDNQHVRFFIVKDKFVKTKTLIQSFVQIVIRLIIYSCKKNNLIKVQVLSHKKIDMDTVASTLYQTSSHKCQVKVIKTILHVTVLCLTYKQILRPLVHVSCRPSEYAL